MVAVWFIFLVNVILGICVGMFGGMADWSLEGVGRSKGDSGGYMEPQ